MAESQLTEIHQWPVTEKSDINSIYCECSRRGFLDAIRFLDDILSIEKPHAYSICLAAAENHFEIIKYIVEKFHLHTNNNFYYFQAFELAAKEGYFTIVKYLVETFQFYDEFDDFIEGYEYVFMCVCMYGHLDIVKYLFDTFPGLQKNNYIDKGLSMASIHGHLDIVKYIVERFHLTMKDIMADENCVMRLALKNKHLHIVKYFIQLCK
jgi:hypothetical protein